MRANINLTSVPDSMSSNLKDTDFFFYFENGKNIKFIVFYKTHILI